MHASFKLLTLLILVPLASAGTYSFQPPAQAGPAVAASGVQWALVLFYPQDAAEASLEAAHADAVNHTRILLASVHRPGNYSTPYMGQEMDEPLHRLAAFVAHDLSCWRGLQAALVEADTQVSASALKRTPRTLADLS